MNGLSQTLVVGAGGFVGSALRYGAGALAHRLDPAATYPYATLAVNVIGCAAIGWLTGLADARQSVSLGLRLFLFVGVLGGFTTFSTFGNETLRLVREGEPWKASANVAVTLVLCLGSVWAGYAVATR